MMLLYMGLGTAVALPVAGLLTDRVGAGIVCLLGAATLLLSTLPFLFAGALTLPLLALALIFRGLGQAWAQMPAMTTAYGSVSIAQMGDAASFLNIAQRLGGALGAIGAVVLLADGPTGEPDSYHLAFAALAAVAALTVVSTLALGSALRVRARQSSRSKGIELEKI